MSDPEAAWRRDHWSPGGGDAFLFYAIYGDVDASTQIDPLKYRTSGLPDALDVRSFSRSQHSEYLQLFEEGYPWSNLVATNPALARHVKRSPACMILQGAVNDPPSLAYFRDAIGFVTFFLDHGGVAVYDAQIMTWWTPSEWREKVFEHATPAPFQHTVILYSNDDKNGVGTWFHTRGMRKFGRPDISMHDVSQGQCHAVTELCNRFIAYQAFGGLVPEGQQVHLAGLERAGVVRHSQDYDDPHFNNVHFEVEWRRDA